MRGKMREEVGYHPANPGPMIARPEIEVPVDSVAARSLEDSSLYVSRELSWLEFNDRVLEEALDETNPLLERLKFIAIYGTNLDEYFMIRISALKQQVEAEIHFRSDDGKLPEEHLSAISKHLRASLQRQMACLHGDLFPALERYGIKIVRYDSLDEPVRASLQRMYDERVFPILTPLAIDRGHPFPYISNLSLSLAVELEEDSPDGPITHFARLKVPNSIPRFVPVEPASEGQRLYVHLEDLIGHNLSKLFPGMRVRSSYLFRVTRDADLILQEDEADDLLRAIESELRKRRFGEPVRLEVAADMPRHIREKLLEALSLSTSDCYENDGMLATSDLWGLVNLDLPELHDPPFTPSIPPRLIGATDLFAVIRDGDLLLQHPYQSFDPVVQFVHQAANDPHVLAIKQTLYRTSGDSPVVSALIEAAENGKQVAVLIELKARFDEENNIHWARNLERVGAHVVYGFAGLKTHGKLTLVVRDEPDGIRRYCHFGTGNYNDKTAKMYTDLSYFTCRPELGADATQLFNALTGFSKESKYELLLVAPEGLRPKMTALIDREAQHAREGRQSGIVAKLNAISDAPMVQALYRASQAGVPIDLIVRGMCILRPGIPGISETIRVRSILGRFLEHSRIFAFENGGDREMYIGSADWMGRNLDRRVETVEPVLDLAIRAQISEILDVFMADNVKARIELPDGTYARAKRAPDEEPLSSQDFFLKHYQAV
jgi:polyphosphate kinase